LIDIAIEQITDAKVRLAIYLVTIGIIIACGIFAQAAGRLPAVQRGLQSSSLWSKIRGNIFLPALFGGRRLEPLPAKLGYLPGRGMTIFVTFYVILNIIFSAVDYRYFQPNVWFKSKGFELNEYVGNRTGTLSLVNMSIAILFAGRNNILIALTGWSQTSFMILHRWTARVASVQAVVHSICYTLAYWEDGYEGYKAYAEKAAQAYYVSCITHLMYGSL